MSENKIVEKSANFSTDSQKAGVYVRGTMHATRLQLLLKHRILNYARIYYSKDSVIKRFSITGLKN